MSDPPSEMATTGPATERAFEFGKNWSRFLAHLNEPRIQAAEESLRQLLACDSLREKTFLDAGSGSGLFSLAAHRMGAKVVSFDADADSIACTRELRGRSEAGHDDWRVEQGSLLDQEFLQSLGRFDVVYCWGVAHHTGEMWNAIEHLAKLVAPGGLLVLAIYNDQQYISRIWHGVKRTYQRLPGFARPVFVSLIGVALFVKRLVVTLLAAVARLITLRNPCVPVVNWARESQARGMHTWHDLVDWVGGWPFEVARPEAIFRFLRDRGFILQELTTSPGHGCNEFVFKSLAESRDSWPE